MKRDETHLSGAIDQGFFSGTGEVLGEGIARIRPLSGPGYKAIVEGISLLFTKTLDKKDIFLLGN
jgi:hypothetical protein